MARKNDSPQKATMREMMRDYLKNNDAVLGNYGYHEGSFFCTDANNHGN